MRILFLTQWFEPEPTFKGLLFARALRERGHEVEVLTGFPNYPAGRLYPGYRLRPWQRERIDGISVTRVPLYPSHNGAPLSRASNYFSFALSAAALGPMTTGPADLIYAYHPPATIAIPAIVARWRRRAPIVSDVQDLWPDAMLLHPAGGRTTVYRVGDSLVRRLYAASTRIVVQSEGFKETLRKRGVPEERLRVILNWCDEEKIQPQKDEAFARELGLAGRFNVLFAGSMGSAQGLDSVLSAAKIVQDSNPRVQFLMLGEGVEKDRLAKTAEAEGLQNMRFFPRVPYEQVGRFLAAADVLLVHLRNTPLFTITIPSKIQAYMHAGRPILAAVGGEAANLVLRAGAGVSCPPGDPPALAAAIGKLAVADEAGLVAMGQNGRSYYDEHLSLRVGVERFEEVFLEARASFTNRVGRAGRGR